jgi:hypothetical protein
MVQLHSGNFMILPDAVKHVKGHLTAIRDELAKQDPQDETSEDMANVLGSLLNDADLFNCDANDLLVVKVVRPESPPS